MSTSSSPAADSTALIDVHGLRVAFGRAPVLREVSLQVPRGQTIALVGANGSGKSTLLRSLVRLELVDAGHGHVLGNSILDDKASFNEDIGYVSEMLEFQLRVKLDAIADLYADLRPSFSRDEFRRVTEMFKLQTNRRATEYSRGQKVQFAFALAISSKPRLLLLDEVTAVLDMHVRDLVMREVRELTAAGASALIATNILTEVLPYANRLLILEEGRIALDTGLEDLDERYVKIRGRPGSPSPAGVDGCRPIKGAADGSLTYLVPKRLLATASAQLIEGVETLPDRVTGEDVFLYHCRKGA